MRHYCEGVRGGGGDASKARAAVERHCRALTPGAEKALLDLLLGRGELDAALKAAATPAEICRAHCYAGYAHLLAGRKKQGRLAFARALGVKQTRQLEHRMALAELTAAPPDRDP